MHTFIILFTIVKLIQALIRHLPYAKKGAQEHFITVLGTLISLIMKLHKKNGHQEAETENEQIEKFLSIMIEYRQRQYNRVKLFKKHIHTFTSKY